MNSKKLFYILIACSVLVVGLFAVGVFQATKILKSEGNKLVDLKLTDKVLEKQQAGLLQAKRDIKEYSDLESVTKSIVPQDKDQASTIAEISSMANQAGISLGAIEFPQSALGQIASKGSKKTNTDASKSQLTELSDLKGVYVMEININSHSKIPVSYDQIISYLKLLESSRRTAQVTNIDIAPDTTDPSKYGFEITLNTYVRPE